MGKTRGDVKGGIFQSIPVLEGCVNKLPPNSVLNTRMHFYLSTGLSWPVLLSAGGRASRQVPSESPWGCGHLTGMAVRDGGSGLPEQVEMASALKGQVSVILATLCWPKSLKAAWIQGGGGPDPASVCGRGVYAQGRQEPMATAFGGKLPPRTRDRSHFSGS